MKNTFFLLVCLQISFGWSQTNVIFHKSHSGSMNCFNPAKIADNLGWTGFERTTFDTSLNVIVPEDTVNAGPFCTDPNSPKDSVNLKYPFYSSALADTVGKSNQTPAQQQMDTLAKPKERIKGRNEYQKNEVDFYGNPINPKGPGAGLILTGFVLTACIGFFIYRSHRKKLQL